MKYFVLILAMLICLTAYCGTAFVVDGRFLGSYVPSGVDIGSPIAWYQMTGTDTNTTQLLDSIGSYNISNLPSVATGPVISNAAPYCYQFGYASQSSFRDKNILFPATNNFAVSLWFFMGSAITNDNSDHVMVDQYVSLAGNGRIAINKGSTSNQIDLFLGSDASGLASAHYQIAPAQAGNQWHHLAVVRSATNWITYFNGGTAKTLVETKTRVILQTAFGIGGQVDFGYWKGAIDDVRVYTNSSFSTVDVLTGTEVTNIYTSGRQ